MINILAPKSDATRLFLTAILVDAVFGNTMVSRPDVSARDVLGLLPTQAGLTLLRNQAMMLALNVVVLAAVAWTITRLGGPLGLSEIGHAARSAGAVSGGC